MRTTTNSISAGFGINVGHTDRQGPVVQRSRNDSRSEDDRDRNHNYQSPDDPNRNPDNR
jgi:hypothetical protein